jgi:hypothetical protein
VIMEPNQITAHNAGWRTQFRFAVEVVGPAWLSFIRWPTIHTMRQFLAILLISECICWGADQPSTVEAFKMRATVQDVVMLGQFSGTIVQTHSDPRFVLTLHIESITPSLSGFTNGSVVSFAIHSPTMLFAGETPKGKAVDFILSRESQVDKMTTSWRLEIERKGQPDGAANGSQPIRSETNRTSSAAGSRR